MNEGIIFGGFLLTKDEFKSIFKDWYAARGEAFKVSLKTDIIDVIDRMIVQGTRVNSKGATVSVDRRVKGQYNAQKVYAAWERISAEFFGNGSVSLIAGLSFGGKEYKWTNAVDEKDLMAASGIKVTKKGLKELESQMTEVQAIMAADEIQDIINNHYKKLESALIDYHMDKQSAHKLHEILTYRKSTIQLRHFTNETYEDVIFSGQRNADGKKLDAFMNHVGKHHAQLFDLMNGQRVSAASLNNTTINFQEDDFMSYFQTRSPFGEPQEWLLDSLNTAGWITGGDVVVVGEKGEVIYNIQLKTTAGKSGKTFELSIKALFEFAKSLLAIFEEETTPEKIDRLCEAMYEKLKTTSANSFQVAENIVTEGVKELIRKDTVEQVRLNLGLKIM